MHVPLSVTGTAELGGRTVNGVRWAADGQAVHGTNKSGWRRCGGGPAGDAASPVRSGVQCVGRGGMRRALQANGGHRWLCVGAASRRQLDDGRLQCVSQCVFVCACVYGRSGCRCGDVSAMEGGRGARSRGEEGRAVGETPPPVGVTHGMGHG